MSNETTAPTPSAPIDVDRPAKLVGLVLGLMAVICVMLFAFAAPSLNSGAKDLPLSVSGPEQARSALVAALAENSPGTFEVTTHDTASQGADAIESREAIGGIVVTSDGMVTIQTAAGAGTPYKSVLTGVGQQLQGAGHKVSYDELAPTTADDPTGSGIGSLGLPLIFGGMAASAALLFLYRGSATNRLIAVTGLAIIGGLATTAILQFGFGVFDSHYWLIATAVAAGILAVAFPVLGLEQWLGTRGLGIMAIILMFVANPLSGLATGPQWLPGMWGEIGQLLPVGAAGTAIRSAAYFDGGGSAQAWAVLATWALAGLTLALVGARRKGMRPA